MTGKRRKRRPMAGGLERFIRGGIVLISAAVFGLGAGALGMYGLLTATLGALTGDAWGAAPVWLLLMAVGGGVGLLAGLGYSIHWLRYREAVAFGPFDWLGILVGLAIGIACFQLVSDRYYWFMQALFLAVMLPPCALVGRAAVGILVRKRLSRRA